MQRIPIVALVVACILATSWPAPAETTVLRGSPPKRDIGAAQQTENPVNNPSGPTGSSTSDRNDNGRVSAVRWEAAPVYHLLAPEDIRQTTRDSAVSSAWCFGTLGG